ncbi:hypothetical protein BKA67DRAFT_695624 [Truncatella angustata]|uniref:Uncharacterized protein n=1 Tax=Truncatella angustata TaxID=152316 RepID=A0A9P8UD57_9PEZI|nr:uncharacterized protein BKA67DRAFT_695624 [Truncatella angustata]KAH6647180.1 hypothetical protein BKA67DRAFT_695624 [Truncatella angustata]
MPSYVITGVSRGLGFEFLRQLSANTDNTIFGLVRDKATTDSKVQAELSGRQNIHIIEADQTDHEALKKAADYVAAATGGSIDYIIVNAAIASKWSSLADFGELSEDTPRLQRELIDTFNVNVVGPIDVFNVFVPLLLKGDTKKAIAISTGLADRDLTVEYDIDVAAPYAISKAALNMAIAKFSALYRSQGILFMAISPGVVNTDMNYSGETEAQQKKAGQLVSSFLKYQPNFKQADTPQDSVKSVLSVIENSSVEGGQAGAFLSHFGTKRWL